MTNEIFVLAPATAKYVASIAAASEKFMDGSATRPSASLCALALDHTSDEAKRADILAYMEAHAAVSKRRRWALALERVKAGKAASAERKPKAEASADAPPKAAFVKGTPEAKAHMAKLRGMRKQPAKAPTANARMDAMEATLAAILAKLS